MEGRRRAAQLPFVALEIEKAEAERARERMSDGGKGVTQISPLTARKAASDAVHVAESYVSDAKRIAREAPELADAIKSGAKTITQAKRELKEAAREERRSENRSRIESAPTPIAAARELGWTKIAAVVLDGNALHAQLAEIDENLCRSNLTPTQEAEHSARRQEMWSAIEAAKSEVAQLAPPQSFAGQLGGRAKPASGASLNNPGSVGRGLIRIADRPAALTTPTPPCPALAGFSFW